MADESDGRRHSIAQSADLVTDPKAKAELEARNALRQFDLGLEIIQSTINTDRPFKLRPSILLSLHRVALEGLSAYAGNFRPAGIGIKGSQHEPVGAHLVPEEIEFLCDYVNENWNESSAIHLAAYVMWRLNWIHPFDDGNGRTSRITSYVVLCVRLGYVLPGTNTIPDQITDNRNPYFDALERADAVWKQEGKVGVDAMEELLSEMLAAQLYGVVEDAQSN